MASILLAEDDDTLRLYLAAALERAGHEVVAARDGEEADDFLIRQSFDLLLTDVVMPGMDGVALARSAQRRQQGIRVMFITGFSGVAVHTRQSGFVEAAVMSKPFHLKDLIDQVAAVLTVDA